MSVADGDRVLHSRHELEKLLEALQPPAHWKNATASLPGRLRGIYAIGPNADQMGLHEDPEFGWRYFSHPLPVQIEAAFRIEELERKLQEYRVKFFEEECQKRGI